MPRRKRASAEQPIGVGLGKADEAEETAQSGVPG